MQVSPALPWEPGQGGTITFREPVTAQQLADGLLLVEQGNHLLTNPKLDGNEVIYKNNSGQTIASVIFDDEQHNVIDFEVAYGSSILAISLQEPLGELSEFLGFAKTDGEQPQQGELALAFAEIYDSNEDVVKCLLTQDGETVIGGVYTAGNTIELEFDGELHFGTPFYSYPKPTEGPFASAKLLPVKIFADRQGDLYLQIYYAPYEASGVMGPLKKNGVAAEIDDEGPIELYGV